MTPLRKFAAEFKACWYLIIEYRISVLIWIVSIVFPLIMLSAWLSVAERGPVGSYDRAGFIAYYFTAVIVRNMTGAWFIWEMDREIRLGQLSFRLLKPMDPIIHYMALALSSKPLRAVLLTPAAAIVMAAVPGLNLATDPRGLGLFVVSLIGAWTLMFLIQYINGLIGFWITQSIGINDLSFFVFSLASGYLIPLDLFPPSIQTVFGLLPFRYAMAFPIELFTNRLDGKAILNGLIIQWLWIGAMYAIYRWVWSRGLRRYSAVGA